MPTCPFAGSAASKSQEHAEAAASRKLRSPLSWGNMRFWQDGYRIGNLGPSHVKESKLVPGTEMKYRM